MRARRALQQLVHVGRWLLRFFHLDTRAGRFDLLATGFFTAALLDYPKPAHGHALSYFLFYLFCSQRAK